MKVINPIHNPSDTKCDTSLNQDSNFNYHLPLHPINSVGVHIF